ncbi:F-box domain-containing protein [Arthroderma uncinatum]|uniref:F-box domain-containing protein n=1 Tax=Arthroderma uncinatum TaxID=74035 RepID=UPI00144AF2E0|nr:F-box domain-containing protein [Arthroderma uncinatum]KAF3490657.1 F-box domain-containing protein [Arthroderma uncinatum]
MTIIVRSEKFDNLVPSAKKMKKWQGRQSRVSMNWTKDISAKLETKVQSKIHLGSKEKSSIMATKTVGRSATTSTRPRVPPLPPYSPLGGLQELFKEVGGTLGPEKGPEDEAEEETELVSPVTYTSRSCVGTMGDSVDDRLCDDDSIFCQSPATVTTIETGFSSCMHSLHGAAHEPISGAATHAPTISPLFYSNSKRKQTIYLTLDSSNHPTPDIRVPTSATCCSATTTCTSIYPWSSVSCIDEETPRNLSPKGAVNGPFSLLDTVDAAAFEDGFRPTNPVSTTLKRRLTVRESKMKALPPYPPLPENVNAQKTGQSLIKRSKEATRPKHSPKALSLPQIPQETDFDMLDNTFQKHRRNISLFPSLEEAAEDLEAHLLTIPSAKETQPLSRTRSPSPFHLEGAITETQNQKEICPVLQSGTTPKMDSARSSLDRLRESIASKQKVQMSHTKSPKNVQLGLKSKWTRLSTFSRRGAGKPKPHLQLPPHKLPPMQTTDFSSPVEKLDFGLNVDLGLPAGFAELDGEPSPREDSIATKPTKRMSHPPKPLAESIILRIFESVSYFDDLFNLATTNRAFYRVFKQHELALVQNTLSRMSLPAWELREMSPPWDDDGIARLGVSVKDEPIPEYTPRLYLQHYSRDLYTMAALKSMILVHCESFLRVETSRALAGLDEQRSAEMDDAFWRVWTFCNLFGCGKGREGDIEAQVDWLRGGVLAESDTKPSASIFSPMPFISNLLLDPPQGFAKGNGGGLSSDQLCDMSEIWTCLVALLDAFHGKCKEARKYGVFDDKGVTPGDVAREESLLEDWTQYLLTLGPSAVLTLISFGPSTPVEQKFARAKSLGWTCWQAPTKSEHEPSRLFFKEAVSRVCRDLPSRPTSLSSSNQSLLSPRTSPQSSRSKRSSQSSIGSQNSARRQRQAGFAAELRQRKVSLDTGLGIANAIPNCDERPTPVSEEVVHRFICSESGTPYLFPTPPAPPISIANSRKPSSSPSPPVSRPTPPPPAPPVEEKISQGRQPMPSTSHTALYYSNAQDTIIPDPADLALQKMVHELGFNEEDAKWALKRTDTGESVDINAAVHLLLVKSNKANISSVEMGLRQRESNIPQTQSDEIYRPTWRWA